MEPTLLVFTLLVLGPLGCGWAVPWEDTAVVPAYCGRLLGQAYPLKDQDFNCAASTSIQSDDLERFVRSACWGPV